MPVVFRNLHVYFSHPIKQHKLSINARNAWSRKELTQPLFLVEEIRNGALKGVLIPTDYTAPMEVIC